MLMAGIVAVFEFQSEKGETSKQTVLYLNESLAKIYYTPDKNNGVLKKGDKVYYFFWDKSKKKIVYLESGQLKMFMSNFTQASRRVSAEYMKKEKECTFKPTGRVKKIAGVLAKEYEVKCPKKKAHRIWVSRDKDYLKIAQMYYIVFDPFIDEQAKRSIQLFLKKYGAPIAQDNWRLVEFKKTSIPATEFKIKGEILSIPQMFPGFQQFK